MAVAEAPKRNVDPIVAGVGEFALPFEKYEYLNKYVATYWDSEGRPWRSVPNGVGTSILAVPNKTAYFIKPTMAAFSFNGCSSITVNGLCDLSAAIACGHVRIPDVSQEETLTYLLASFLRNLSRSFGPAFFNLPPRQLSPHWELAFRLMECMEAEVACKFVNPNYPERMDKEQYTTLFVMNSYKFLNPISKHEWFKGLIK